MNQRDKNKEVIKDAENFIHILLKVRLLFDEFVIKRHELDSKEDWSLKRVIYNKDDNLQLINTYSEKNKIEVDTETKSDAQRKLLMLLSMFHVSFPTQTYKYWLLGVLDYLYSAQTVDTKNYISYINYTNYLETLAYNLMKMRFLVDESLDYHQIIFTQDKNTSNVDQNIEKYLSYQEIKHNFVFNYVDYILWQNDAIKSQSKASFKFTFRNSVEHFYPQNDDYVKKLTSEYQRNKIIHSFGNLCLISHSLNSKLSNHSSTEKKNYIQENKIHQSLKLSLMLEEKEWNGDAILKHHDDILKKLISALN